MKILKILIKLTVIRKGFMNNISKLVNKNMIICVKIKPLKIIIEMIINMTCIIQKNNYLLII